MAFEPNSAEQQLLDEATSQGLSRRDILKRGAVLGLAAPAMGAILAACSKDKKAADTTVAAAAETTAAAAETSAPAAETSAAAAETSAAAAASGDTPKLVWRTRPDNDAEANLYKSISDLLQPEFKDFTLEYSKGGSEGSPYQDQLKTEIAGGTAPDVFWIPGTDTADFGVNGLTSNLRDLADKDTDYKDSDFYEGPMYHLTYDPAAKATGKALWGLPRDVSTFALYLNMDLIKEAGADDPRELEKAGKWDWDAFLGVAKKVTALGGGKFGYGASAWWGPYGVWVNAAGGSFFNADRTGQALDTPEALKGLEFARTIYNDLKVAVPYGEDPEPVFNAGNVAMFQNGRWATPGARANVKFNWDVVGLPKGPQGTSGNWLFWGSYAVNAKTKNREGAWKLIRALTRADIQAKIAELGANIPSRVSDEAKKAFLSYSPPANNQAFLDGIDPANKPTAEGPLWAGSWPKFDGAAGPLVEGVMKGTSTIDDFKGKAGEINTAAFTA